MAGLLEEFMQSPVQVQAPPSGGNALFDEFVAETAPPPVAPVQEPKKVYSGGLLPFSADEAGNVSFDPNAGVLGWFARPAQVHADVLAGKENALSDRALKGALEAATIASPLPAAMRAGERAIPGVLMAGKKAVSPKVPTAEALKEASGAGYKKASEMGVDYASTSVKGFADDSAKFLDEEGFIAELSPKTHAILGKLREPPADSVASLKSLDAFRKQLGRLGGSKDETEAAAAKIVTRRLDEYLESSDPSRVVGRTYAPGNAAPANVPRIGGTVGHSAEEVAQRTAEEAATNLKDARGNAAARFRSERIIDAKELAEMRAAAANSGQNIGNALRQKLTSLLASDEKSRGFNPQELAAIRKVVDGTATSNTLRFVANLFGGGGGLGAAVYGVAGAATGSTALAGLPFLGAGMRGIYNRNVQRQIANIDQMVRARSPLYQQMQQNIPMVTVQPTLRAAAMRGMIPSLMDPERSLLD